MGTCMHHNRHFYSNGKRLYRSRERMLFGVCKGIAEWKDLPVGWVRFFTVLAFMSTGFFPVGLIYLIAAIVIPIEPPGYYRNSSHDSSFSHNDYDDRFDSSDRYDEGKYKRRYDNEDDWDRRFSRKKRGDQ